MGLSRARAANLEELLAFRGVRCARDGPWKSRWAASHQVVPN